MTSIGFVIESLSYNWSIITYQDSNTNFIGVSYSTPVLHLKIFFCTVGKGSGFSTPFPIEILLIYLVIVWVVLEEVEVSWEWGELKSVSRRHEECFSTG